METNELNDDFYMSSSDESADSHLSAEGYIDETDHSNNHHSNNNNVNNNAKNNNQHHNNNNNSANKYNSANDFLARLWHIWSKQWKTTTIRTPSTMTRTITRNSTLSQNLTKTYKTPLHSIGNFNSSASGSIALEPNVLSLANNYEDSSLNIALIDSTETFSGGSNDDYAALRNGDSMQSSIVRGINRVHKMIDKNATLKQIFDGGGEMSKTTTTTIATDMHSVNDISYKNNNLRDKSESGGSGSSFMLLFEDLGDYFYNYNGSVVSGTTTINNTYFNELYNRTNCTNFNTTNTTAGCYDFIAGKFYNAQK